VPNRFALRRANLEKNSARVICTNLLKTIFSTHFRTHCRWKNSTWTKTQDQGTWLPRDLIFFGRSFPQGTPNSTEFHRYNLLIETPYTESRLPYALH
jgi:hypothetical protein